MPPELAPDYYLTNFHALLSSVVDRYADLLDPDEHAWHTRFSQASVDAQCLYVRLLSRTKSHFRRDKLDYAEIDDLAAAAAELDKSRLLTLDPDLPLDEQLGLYIKGELFEACAKPPAKTLSREALVTGLIEDPDAWAFDPSALATHGPILQIEGETCFTVFRLLFFGNLYQDLSDFVLRDLGLTAFESYTVDADTRAFHSRDQIDAHLRYHACRAIAPETRALDAETLLALHSALPPVDGSDPALARRVGRFTNELARQLERLDEPTHALALYATTTRPPARERRVRVLAALGDTDAALALCDEIASSPLDADEADFAHPFAQRLLRKLGRRGPVPAPAKPLEVEIELPETTLSVEQAVAVHLGCDGSCHYVENTLFTGVFGLAFWDIIFSPVPGAFHNPFQYAPADFREPDFCTQRHAAIADRLDAVQTRDDLTARVLDTFDAKYGLANPMTHWPALDRDTLQLALERIPLAHWHAVFTQLLSDIASYRAGLPDLIHFPAAGHYELVEVKAPGDRLQQNQLRWMRHFDKHGIPHRVVHVRWTTDTVPA